jgi:3-mercaptopyruvate sulfurtransferase SseA
VVADITVSYVSSGARKQLLTFSAEAKDAAKLPTGKAAAAFNAEIAAALAAEKAAPEKLSPDVEAQARRLGHAAGEKVVAYAREHGWIAAPEAAATEPAEKPVRMPPPRPEAKPAT